MSPQDIPPPTSPFTNRLRDRSLSSPHQIQDFRSFSFAMNRLFLSPRPPPDSKLTTPFCPPSITNFFHSLPPRWFVAPTAPQVPSKQKDTRRDSCLSLGSPRRALRFGPLPPKKGNSPIFRYYLAQILVIYLWLRGSVWGEKQIRETLSTPSLSLALFSVEKNFPHPPFTFLVFPNKSSR